MLEKAGVKTELLNIKGVVHGFFTFPGTLTIHLLLIDNKNDFVV